MKKLAILSLTLLGFQLNSQTNTFPSSGNVGIGTSSPVDKLVVLDGKLRVASGGDRMYLNVDAPNNRSQIAFGDDLDDRLDFYFDYWNGTSYDKEVMSVLANGNVGIGTTTPGSKLTVKGHVNIGDDGNYRLRVRHVDGKTTNSTNIDDLYLNHNSGKNVRIGFGSGNPRSNLYLSGKLGLGFTSPTHHIDVINSIDPTEAFLRFRLQDAPNDFFQITNATGTPNQFLPVIKGSRVSDNRYSIQFMGVAAASNDSGSNAVVNFDARYGSGTIQNRPLFVWTNYTSKMMTMLANGNLGIGTTNPGTYKLAVNGKIRAKEIKVETGWADYVFKEGYNLPTLAQVEKHIKEKGHLPNIPSAKEVAKNGIQLGEMNKLLLEKIEELTLYTLQQEKRLIQLENLIKNFKK